MIDCELFLYADDTCLVYQPKDVKEIEQDLKTNFPNDFYWFIDNNQSIRFGYEKTKSILFGIKYKVNKVGSLDISYGVINIKQYKAVTYLGCSLDGNLSGESMALKVINKINSRCLYWKNRFISQPVRRLSTRKQMAMAQSKFE